MDGDIAQPWFDSALTRLGVRRGNRLLAIGPSPREVAALRAVLGDAGELTVTMADRAAAEALAARAWAGLHVLHHRADDGEAFGTFDSLLVAPRTGPIPPPAACGQLARANLRPGGRFVFDLPAPDMVPDLRAAWLDLGWDEERLLPLAGVADVELTDALREAGLRNVESALGSHLVRVASAAELAAAFADALRLDDADLTELGHAVVRRRQDPGPLEVLVHRTQVGGQR